MLSLLKTVLTIAVLFVQLSSSAVLKRHDGWPAHYKWRCHGPWCKHTKSHTLTLATSTAASPQTSVAPTFVPTYASTTPDSTSEIEIIETSFPASTDSEEDDETPTSTDAGPIKATSTAPGEAVTPTTLMTATVIPQPATTSPTSAASTKASATVASTGALWKPSAGATWQIELSGTTDTSLPVSIYDLDLFDVSPTTISTLHAAGKKVICYFSAGSFENWRSDASSFTAADKGSAMEGWAGEWWLNTNSANVRSIMTTRIELAKSKGCDGIDPDNVDGYANANGVGLTEANAVDYLTFLSNTAHSHSLSIGLKNAGGLVDSVLPMMDFHVNEQCLQYNECELFQPFIQSGKPVFHIEYPDAAPNITPDVKTTTCGAQGTNGFSTVLKTLELNAWVESC